MPIDFHAEENRFTYALRIADPSWRAMLSEIVSVKGKSVVDIGCGGGIYARALADMGAANVTGMDFSEEMLKTAREQSKGYANIQFVLADACMTGLTGAVFDVVLQRALIHHLPQVKWSLSFAEARRVLKSDGVLIVQDRTPEDCFLAASAMHVRGYFFERYPKLRDVEMQRRPESRVICEALEQVGFKHIGERKLWEVAEKYPNIEGLFGNLLARSGSILHDLTDNELADLVGYIQKKVPEGGQEVVQQDRWTIWSARKKKSSVINMRILAGLC